MPIPSNLLQQWRQDWDARAGTERSLRVRWVLNADAEPLANVELTEFNGQIVDLRERSSADQKDVLPVALIPPLVNAHTHLEFSSLPQPLEPAQPFPAWIQSVMHWRRTSGDSAAQSITSGLKESARSAVRLIGEISTDSDASMNHGPQINVIQFREVIGLRPERIEQQLQIAGDHLNRPNVSGVIRALSPHAPYTVHPDLLAAVVSLSVQHQVPVAMHLAETLDELELLHTGGGRFRDFLKELGLFDESTFPGGRTILSQLQQLAKAPKALAVHGNYFSAEDIQFLCQHPNITTVYCPRTHHFFGHTGHPLRQLLAAGCRVILGTDSRASNPDLDIWQEMQHVANAFPQLSPGALMAMVTTHSAEAMGVDAKPFQIRQGSDFFPGFLVFDPSVSSVSQIMRHEQTNAFVA